MSFPVGQLQLIFDALILMGLMWLWSRDRQRSQAPPVPEAQAVEPPRFDEVLRAEEAIQRLQQVIQAADTRLRSLRVSAADMAPETGNVYGAVRAMHRSGLDAQVIAQELSIPKAEVRLVLSLNNPQESRPSAIE